MGKLFWFNPENDLALAANLPNYTPPSAAIRLRQAGALLPLLWAKDDDRVLVTAPTDCTDERVVNRLSGSDILEPWGWSLYAANALRHHGAMPTQLPYEEQLNEMRRLSHREIATQVLQHTGYDPQLTPRVATTATEAREAIGSLGGDCVVKLPWSCSGRGVFAVANLSQKALDELLEGMIRRQGAVTVEPRYDRVTDFATLFHKQGGEVRFRGVSLFSSDHSGHYAGNLIAPQDELRRRIGADLDATIDALTDALSALTDGYEGWIGVDMLTYHSAAGELLVAPCIEVNLRMTMGVAALLTQQSGTLPFQRGRLRVALPGETLNEGTLTFAAIRPQTGQPLASPCVVVEPI